jgi:protein-disulfide isomerase
MAIFFNATMKSNSKLPPDDNIPEFFSIDDDKNIEKSSDKKNNDISLDNTQPKIQERRSNIGIHWQSLGIGAGIAIACIFCGVLLVNMINTDSTQVLDEITIREITSIKKPTIASFYDNASPILGDTDAPLTLVEFGDYQCTYCKKFFHETEESILINYVETGKVKMLFKDFIVVNEDSINAASAAHCANDQKMFWQYHSTLYNNWDGEGTGWASSEHLHQFASTLGLDMNRFSECMSQSKWKDLVNSSHADGRTLGVDATPTFFIIDQNNQVLKITGAQHYDVFQEVFDSLLEK